MNREAKDEKEARLLQYEASHLTLYETSGSRVKDPAMTKEFFTILGHKDMT